MVKRPLKITARRRTTQRLALLEAMKTMPFVAVRDEVCRRDDVIPERGLIQANEKYEKKSLSGRD